MSEFEKLLAEFMESEQYKDDSFHWSEMARAFYDKGVTAGQAASASRVAELEKRIAALWYDPRLDTANARITELQADCKVMAEGVLAAHRMPYGLNTKPEAVGTCTCRACTIAAKYREG